MNSGAPRSDNAPEFVSKAVLKWIVEEKIGRQVKVYGTLGELISKILATQRVLGKYE